MSAPVPAEDHGFPNPLPLRRYFPQADAMACDGLGGLRARRVAPGDLAFLQQLYASTRAEELAASGWPADEQEAFLVQQFGLQHRYYQEHHRDADFLLLSSLAGQPLGRLYWRAIDAEEAALIDVSLIPQARGRGLGTALMSMLVSQADRLGQSIGLHVEPDNPARRLYERHGFELLSDNGVYARMQRPATTTLPMAFRTESTLP